MQSTEAVEGYSSALRVLMAPDFLKGEKYQEQQWRAVRKGADARIIIFADKLISRMAKLGVPMFAHNMVRTWDEQDALKAQGVSNASGGQSPHNFGLAVDIVHSIKAWDLTRESWDDIGHIGKEVAKQNGVPIVWGGDWSRPWDPAHWELKNWRSRASEKLATL